MKLISTILIDKKLNEKYILGEEWDFMRPCFIPKKIDNNK